MNDVMEVIKKNYTQPQLIPAMLALKRYCPELTPPINLSYMSSSHTYLNFARAHMQADCPIRNDNKPILEIRKELEEYMPRGDLPPSIRLKLVVPERQEKQLPAFSEMCEKAFAENKVIVFEHFELVGRNTVKCEISMRKDSKTASNHFYGPKKLAELFQVMGFDFVTIKEDTSIQLNLCYQTSPAEDLYLVPVILAAFLRYRHEDLSSLCNRLQKYIGSTERPSYTVHFEKEDKPVRARTSSSRA